jgi:uncharacterized protein YjbJ (UPF0337 family)
MHANVAIIYQFVGANSLIGGSCDVACALRAASLARAMGARQSHGKEYSMNWDRIEGNWKQVKGKLKEQWGKLTDDDLDRIAGKRDQLVGKIQEQYGITKDEAEKQVDKFGDTVRDDDFRRNQ